MNYRRVMEVFLKCLALPCVAVVYLVYGFKGFRAITDSIDSGLTATVWRNTGEKEAVKGLKSTIREFQEDSADLEFDALWKPDAIKGLQKAAADLQ
jgi:hypothetical protein